MGFRAIHALGLTLLVLSLTACSNVDSGGADTPREAILKYQKALETNDLDLLWSVWREAGLEAAKLHLDLHKATVELDDAIEAAYGSYAKTGRTRDAYRVDTENFSRNSKVQTVDRYFDIGGGDVVKHDKAAQVFFEVEFDPGVPVETYQISLEIDGRWYIHLDGASQDSESKLTGEQYLKALKEARQLVGKPGVRLKDIETYLRIANDVLTGPSATMNIAPKESITQWKERQCTRLHALVGKNYGLSVISGSEIKRVTTDRLIAGIAARTMIDKGDREKLYAMGSLERTIDYLASEKRALDILAISAAQLANTQELTLSPDEIESYFRQHETSFYEPERVKLKYVSFNRDNLAAKIDGRERRVSHILIRVAPDADNIEVQQAREKALRTLLAVLSGEDFTTLAREWSEDAKTKDQGGDLGFIDLTLPAFAAAVFDREVGDVVGPVRTDTGFHVLTVTEIRQGEVTSNGGAHSKNAPSGELNKTLLNQLFLKRRELLDEYISVFPLNFTAEKLGFEVRQSDWLSADSGQGIGRFESVRNAVFGKDVAGGGMIRKSIEVEPGHVLALQVSEREAARPRLLEQVEEDVRAAIKRERSIISARKKAEAMLERLKAGASFEELSRDTAVRQTNFGVINLVTEDVPEEVQMDAFHIPPPEVDQLTLSLAKLENGDYAVIRARVEKPGTREELSDVERYLARKRLIQILCETPN